MYKIIAETAFSHEGDFSYLLSQIEEASKAKVDYVKFQVFINVDQYIVPNHPTYDILKKWIFSKAQWKYAFKTAKDKSGPLPPCPKFIPFKLENELRFETKLSSVLTQCPNVKESPITTKSTF